MCICIFFLFLIYFGYHRLWALMSWAIILGLTQRKCWAHWADFSGQKLESYYEFLNHTGPNHWKEREREREREEGKEKKVGFFFVLEGEGGLEVV